MIIIVVVIFGTVFVLKWMQIEKNKKSRSENKVEIATVSSVSAKESNWKNQLKVVGSSRTVKGVNVTTQLAGMVTKIDFQPGAYVKKGDLLAQLNIAPDLAQLHELQTQAWLAKVTLRRDLKQYAAGGVSKQTVDNDKAALKSDVALVQEQQANIEKKTIRAPFSGKLGVRQINPGQYLNPGDTVVNLQTMQPIWIDFFIPQHEVANISVGQKATITLNNKKTFHGKITTINPELGADIRNVKVEVTLPNEKGTILPGMFMYVTVDVGEIKKYITLPQQAVVFNPYGALVYILTKTKQKQNNKTVWKATQKFIKTGMVRGDQVAITDGIKVGDVVVASGQIKIQNGSLVVIDNNWKIHNSPNPKVSYNE